MNVYYWLPIFLLLLIVFTTQRSQQQVILKQLLKKRKQKGASNMVALAKRFIDKECIVYTFNSQLEGFIREVSEGAILLEKEGKTEAVNLDFVVRIREYPLNKKGRKKAFVAD